MFGKRKEATQGLNIIIVGGGKVGVTLVEQLAQEGHDITIIDQNAKVVESITNTYDAMGVIGNGASYSTQMEAGIENADLFIAVTNSDELNLLCCTVAKRAGNLAAIARVRTPDYSKEVDYFIEKLGLAMIINPDFVSSRVIAKILTLPTALDVTSFSHGRVNLVRIELPEDNPLCNRTIAELGRDGIIQQTVICAIERDGKVFIPSGDFIIRAKDIISFAASQRESRQFLKKIGFKTGQVKTCMIVGGGRAGYYAAELLIKAGINVRIIEIDQNRCERLSELLPEATIIHGDGTSEELLKEEGIEDVDAFIPLTGIDEENILLSLHAKKVSHAKVITRLTRNNFMEVVNGLDLGSVLYPKYITSEAIIAYVRARNNSKGCNIETLYHMFDSRAEAIEFKVEKASDVVDVPLSKLSLKKDLLIAFINRNGKIIIPKGQDVIKVKDTVMIVTTHKGFKDIQDILA
ncbi:MAG: Trk system potassium transporter TrkA [Lachnospiraceae bacterium]|nr:Trk system potassium transporter TrkA [Lachnospiraceae bacterium]